jgi:hypothetical protein
MVERRRPGLVRDAIISTFKAEKRQMSVAEIRAAVNRALNDEIPPSSIRSYLAENEGKTFRRTHRGRYTLIRG